MDVNLNLEVDMSITMKIFEEARVIAYKSDLYYRFNRKQKLGAVKHIARTIKYLEVRNADTQECK